ncbi:hypothetical protein NPIL_555691 [Nephila pilipes]|uniref:Uncharacterized protein n=1 Tax=Nephila pilipes TaxID=299642 RepID=A0A8X6MEU8_NEPPI|nr:hypothetical protein NPIL_555691 [Nephila pilipes]
MKAIASESAAGTSSAREAGRGLSLPPSLMRNIFHGVLNQYPYKLLSYHELLPSDTMEREAFVRGSFITGPLFCFEIEYPVNERKRVTVNAQDYLTLLLEKVVI